MTDNVYRVVIALPLLARATSAEHLRRQIEGMSLDNLMFEVSEGAEMIAGTRTIDVIEHVPASDVERELKSIGNDGTFFEDMLFDGTSGNMGDDHEEGEGKDQD